jgi:serine/threonine-protein kinase
MGEVYRARDTRLERTVAVKVLPTHLSSSPETRQRFEREAKTISQLSHPHICALHDVGSQDGVEYLVMELLEGETLAARLARGALPLEQTLRFGQEIADALDKAHRQGIVHRDLKPGNVMLTKSGVKLLDFGLAKAIAPAAAKGSLTSLPTQQGLTQEGTILGTFQYMAPEQLEGKEADSRTDIFALGAVLYEMATGKKAFSGASQASLISSIMTAEPPSISTAQPMSPPALDRVVKTCLAKDPEDRWQSAADVGRELKWVAEGSAAGVAAPRVLSSRRRMRELVAWLIVVAAVAALILSRRNTAGPGASANAPVRLDLELPAGERPLTASEFAGTTLTVASDGSGLVYVARQGASWELRYRNLQTGETTSIPGTLGGLDPFFSPDGRWVGFTSDWVLRKVAVSGGTPVEVSEASRGRGGFWTGDGAIYFVPNLYGGIARVSQDGGPVTTVTELDKTDGEKTHRWPILLPGGKALVYAALTGRSWDQAQIVLKRLDTGERRVLIRGGTSPRYAPSGHLVYARGTSLYAVPFDLARLAVTGQSVEVARDTYVGQSGSSDAAFTTSGMLLYILSSSVQSHRLLTRVDRQGVGGPLSDRREEFTYPRVSPDGSRILVEFNSSLTIFDVQRRTFTPLTSGPRSYRGAWTPDGKRVVFASEMRGPWNVYAKAADGSAPETALWPNPVIFQIPLDVSSDGKSVLVQVGNKTLDVFDTSAEGKAQSRTLIATEAPSSANFSPDGRWVVYAGGKVGQPEVFVVPASGGEGKWQISSAGGMTPRWSPSGKEIFYLEGERLMVVAVKTEPKFEPGVPQELFSKPDLQYFDVFPDGDHFLIVEAPETPSRRSLGVVVNWFSVLSSASVQASAR